MAKRSDYSDAEFGQRLQRMYDSAAQLHADGKTETHPSEHVNAWAKDIKGARDSLPGNVGVAKEIEGGNDPLGDSDPLESADPSTPGGNRAGGKTAQDAALEELAIRQRAGYNMDGELHLARVRRGNSSSASIAAMDSAIPGYGRLK